MMFGSGGVLSESIVVVREGCVVESPVLDIDGSLGEGGCGLFGDNIIGDPMS